MLILIASYRAQPGTGTQVVIALQAMQNAVAASEPECLSYQPARALDDPDAFVIYEVYKNAAALDAHRLTPHFRAIIEAHVLPLLAERIVRQYSPLNERDLNAT